MPLRLCHILCCIFLPGFTQAQSYNIKDSLLAEQYLAKAEDLFNISKHDSAISFADKALQISLQGNVQYTTAMAYLKKSDIDRSRFNLDKIGQYDSAALKIATVLKNPFLLALTEFQLGQYFTAKNDYDKGEMLLKKSLDTHFGKNTSEYTAAVNGDLGHLYAEKGNYDMALEYYLKAVRISETLNDDKGLARALSSISTLYYDYNVVDEAIKYAKYALRLRLNLKDPADIAVGYNNLAQLYSRVDSLEMALQYQELGMEFAQKSGNEPILAHSYLGMGLLKNKQKKIKEAFEYEKKAIDIFEALQENAKLSNRYIAAAFYSAALNDSVNAVNYYNKSINLATKVSNKRALQNAYIYRSDFYKSKKDFTRAYDDYKKYILYRDSLQNADVTTRIAELETKYETEKKDNEIVRLQAEQRINKLQAEKQQAIIKGNLQEAKQKEQEIQLLSQQQLLRDAQLKQKSEELEKQQLLAKNTEQALKLSESEKKIQQTQINEQKQFRNFLFALIGASILLATFLFNRYQLKKKIEKQQALLDVRNLIAKDLHDDIGSTLNSIKILSEVSQSNLQKNSEKAADLIQKITEQSAKMQQGMADIVWAVKPDADKVEDLMVRIREYVALTLEQKGIETMFEADDASLKTSLSMQARRDIFLVIKEALNNLAKYSEATKASISIQALPQKITIQISDNGKGFITNKTFTSNGLKNMRSRVEALNGKFNVESLPGNGCRIDFWIPAT